MEPAQQQPVGPRRAGRQSPIFGFCGSPALGRGLVLSALDHTHGFEIGFVANRHTLIAACFGALALAEHVRRRSEVRALSAWLSPLFYALALLSSEVAVAACGYFVAYALFVERGIALRRALTILPYLIITAAWRVGYVLGSLAR